MKIASLKYIDNNSDTLDVLLHGSSGGMNYTLMQKVFDESVRQGHSVANFNFPYFERGQEQFKNISLKGSFLDRFYDS